MGLKHLRKDTHDLLKSSYLPQRDAEALMKKKGYTYDKDLSSMESKVFVKNGRPTIASRGSIRLTDWIEDGLLTVGLGRAGHRQNDIIKLNKALEEKYHKPVNAVGHSLAGRLIENSGAKGNIITYNKAVGPLDTLKKTGDKQLDIKTSTDLVSGLGFTHRGNKEIVSQKLPFSINPFTQIYNAHHVDNIKPKEISNNHIEKQGVYPRTSIL